MANVCNFSLLVTGPEHELDSFKAAVEKHVERIENGAFKGEFIVSLDTAIWGNLDGHDCFWADCWYYDKERNAVVQGDGAVHRVGGGLLIVGESRWMPPAKFIERASSLFPGLDFNLHGTIEHELYEHWTAKNGQAVQVEERLENLQTGEVIRWVKDGKALVGAMPGAGKVTSRTGSVGEGEHSVYLPAAGDA